MSASHLRAPQAVARRVWHRRQRELRDRQPPHTRLLRPPRAGAEPCGRVLQPGQRLLGRQRPRGGALQAQAARGVHRLQREPSELLFLKLLGAPGGLLGAHQGGLEKREALGQGHRLGSLT